MSVNSTILGWQLIFGGIFIFQILLVSLAGGLVLYQNPKILRIPGFSRFLMGAALSPYIIGLYTWLLGGIPIKLPTLLYILPLYLLSIYIVFHYRTKLLNLYQKLWRRNYSSWECTFFIALVSIGIPSIIGITLIYQRIIKPDIIFLLLIIFSIASLFFLLLFLLIYRAKIDFHMLSSEKHNSSLYVIFTIMLMGISAISLRFLVFGKFKQYTMTINKQILFFILLSLLFFIIFLLMRALYTHNITVKGILHKTPFTKHQIKERFSSFFGQFIRLCAPICFIALCFYLTIILTSTFISPITGADASQYSAEALAYAKTMNWSDANGFLGSKDGALLANIHSFAWPAYLANALLHIMPGTEFGYPNDFPLRIAIHMNIPLLIMAIIAVAGVFQKKLLIASVLLFFGSTDFRTVINGASRDAYRLIPLILLVCVLIGAEKALHKKCFNIKFYIIPCLIGAFVMMGHPINAFSAVAIILAFTFYLLLVKKFSFQTIILYSVILVGAILGSLQILFAFISTGKMTGGLIDINDILYNTPYYDNFMNYSNGRLQNTNNFLERFLYIIFHDNGLINILGIVFSLILLFIIIFKYIHNNKYSITLFVYLIVLFNIILLLDIFGWSGFSLTQWYVKNMRYTLHLKLFFAFGLSCALCHGFSIIYKNLSTYSDVDKGGIAAFLGAILLFPLLIGALQWGFPSYKSSRNYIEDNFIPVHNIIESIGNRRLLIDNYCDNYYYNNKALSIFTEPAKTILHAQTFDELAAAFKENNIGAVIIKTSYVGVYWKDSLLLNYLNKNAYSPPPLSNLQTNTVFILSLMDDTYSEKIKISTPPDYIDELGDLIPFSSLSDGQLQYNVYTDINKLTFSVFEKNKNIKVTFPERYLPLKIINLETTMLVFARKLYNRSTCLLSVKQNDIIVEIILPKYFDDFIFRNASYFDDGIIKAVYFVSFNTAINCNQLFRLILHNDLLFFDDKFCFDMKFGDNDIDENVKMVAVQSDSRMYSIPSLYIFGTQSFYTYHLWEVTNLSDKIIYPNNSRLLEISNNETDPCYLTIQEDTNTFTLYHINSGQIEKIIPYYQYQITIEYNIQTGKASMKIISQPDDYIYLLRKDLENMPHGGLMDIGSNNYEGRLAWSQAYYLNGFIELLMPEMNILADTIQEFNQLRLDIIKRLHIEIMLLNLLFNKNEPGLICRRYSLDRFDSKVMLQNQRILQVMNRYQHYVPQPATLTNHQNLIEFGFLFSDTLEGIHTSDINDINGIPSGITYMLFAETRHNFTGAIVPFNYMSDWISTVLYMNMLGYSVEEQYIQWTHDFCTLLLKNKEFLDFDSDLKWPYATGLIYNGWSEIPGSKLLQYPGNKHTADITYRSIDAQSIFLSMKTHPALYNEKIITYLLDGISNGKILPFVSARAFECGYQAPFLKLEVIHKNLRLHHPWNIHSAIWAYHSLLINLY
jgi:hypothetical protein